MIDSTPLNALTCAKRSLGKGFGVIAIVTLAGAVPEAPEVTVTSPTPDRISVEYEQSLPWPERFTVALPPFAGIVTELGATVNWHVGAA